MVRKLRSKRELKTRIKRLNPEKRVAYLQEILSGESLVGQPSRDVVYSLMGDIYREIGKKEIRDNTNNNSTLVLAVESYIKAGDFSKASWTASDFIKTKEYTAPNLFPHYVTAIPHDSLEGKRLEKLINKEKTKRGVKITPEKKSRYFVHSILIIGGILAGLFFLSQNVTGNVVGNSGNLGNWILGSFLIIGLVIGYVRIKKRKNFFK